MNYSHALARSVAVNGVSARRQGRQERLRVWFGATFGCFSEGFVFARALLTQGKVNLAFGHRSRLLMRSLISPLQSIINALLYE